MKLLLIAIIFQLLIQNEELFPVNERELIGIQSKLIDIFQSTLFNVEQIIAYSSKVPIAIFKLKNCPLLWKELFQFLQDQQILRIHLNYFDSQNKVLETSTFSQFLSADERREFGCHKNQDSH